MKTSHSKSFAENTLILLISMVFSKIIGAVFKIPLTNIIGGIGMGYYSTAYSLYTPVFSLTAAAVPTVIVKAVAACSSEYKCSCRTILKTALVTFGGIGLVGMLFMLAIAIPFTDFVAHSPESLLSVIMIAPSVMLCCISSVFKGYYEGCCNMAPSAVSQVIESITRAVFGLTVSVLTVNHGISCYEAGLPVYGQTVSDINSANSVILPIAAAAAISAVTVSEFAAALCLIIRYKFDKSAHIKPTTKDNVSKRRIAKLLLKESLPISLGAIAVNLNSFIDLITIPRCIGFSVIRNPQYYAESMAEIIRSQGGQLQISNFLYGSYTGVTMTMFMLVPCFTGMLGRSALPEIASAWARGDTRLFKSKLSMVLKSNFIIGFPLYMGLAALSEPLLSMLYSARPEEVSVSVLPLFILCIGGVFMTLSSTFFAVFQVIGRADLPIKLVLCSSAVKLILNVFLISIPEVNISGAAISAVTANATAAFGGYLAMEKVSGSDFHIIKCLSIPLLSGAACAISAYLSFSFFEISVKVPIKLILSVILAGIVYTFLLIITRYISVKNLLFRRKIKK